MGGVRGGVHKPLTQGNTEQAPYIGRFYYYIIIKEYLKVQHKKKNKPFCQHRVIFTEHHYI